MLQKTKISYISFEKELNDSLELINLIKHEVDDKTILVNCSPWYSSRLTQLVNHKTSYLNNGEPLETIPLEFPFPNMNQIFNVIKNEYELFDRYFMEWKNKYIYSESKYAFICAHPFMEKSLMKIKNVLKGTMEYIIVCPYTQEFEPNYSIQKFPIENRILYEWENADNPNFKTN